MRSRARTWPRGKWRGFGLRFVAQRDASVDRVRRPGRPQGGRRRDRVSRGGDGPHGARCPTTPAGMHGRPSRTVAGLRAASFSARQRHEVPVMPSDLRNGVHRSEKGRRVASSLFPPSRSQRSRCSSTFIPSPSPRAWNVKMLGRRKRLYLHRQPRRKCFRPHVITRAGEDILAAGQKELMTMIP